MTNMCKWLNGPDPVDQGKRQNNIKWLQWQVHYQSLILWTRLYRSALTTANLPADNFAGHSFRIGAATTATSAGICDFSIQSLGQWKRNAYLLYIRTAPQQLARVCFNVSVQFSSSHN